jgi:hypothetical protein
VFFGWALRSAHVRGRSFFLKHPSAPCRWWRTPSQEGSTAARGGAPKPKQDEAGTFNSQQAKIATEKCRGCSTYPPPPPTTTMSAI